MRTRTSRGSALAEGLWDKANATRVARLTRSALLGGIAFTGFPLERRMADQPKKWRTYEEVATYLLNQMAEEFGLEKVKADQTVLGLRSGTKWKVEGKGIADGGDRFVIVECRRYSSSKLDQESIGGLAYRISDAGASGGIVVTPVGLRRARQRLWQLRISLL